MTEATRPAQTNNETEKTTYAPDAIELQELGALPTAQALPQAAAFLADLVQDRSFLESQVQSVLREALDAEGGTWPDVETTPRATSRCRCSSGLRGREP